MPSSISGSKPKKSKTKPLTIRELLGIKDVKNGIIIRESHAAYQYIMLLEITPINFKLKSISEQEFIIKSYEELLKVLKCPFQVSVISRKADVTAHSKYMEKQMQNNSDENLKIHLDEYLSFFREVSSRSAVSRQFILSLPFVPPAGVNPESIEFMQVVDTLYEAKGRVKQCMTKCGNEVIDHEDPDYFAYDVLYRILNRVTSETQSLPKKMAGFYLEVK